MTVRASVRVRREQGLRPPRRPYAWHRDIAANAMSIARWEDDGGRAGTNWPSTQPPSTPGRMVPWDHRDL
jgi:hypothetical protein